MCTTPLLHFASTEDEAKGGSRRSKTLSLFLPCVLRRYNPFVHKAWHNAGYAPALYAFKPLPGGWYMVEMEFLGEGA